MFAAPRTSQVNSAIAPTSMPSSSQPPSRPLATPASTMKLKGTIIAPMTSRPRLVDSNFQWLSV